MAELSNFLGPVSVGGTVTVSTDFTISGRSEPYLSRALVSDIDAIITIQSSTGATYSVRIAKGWNPISCAQVTNLGGASLTWYA